MKQRLHFLLTALMLAIVGTTGMQAKLKIVTWDAEFIQNIQCWTTFNSVTTNNNNSKDGITVRWAGGAEGSGWSGSSIAFGNSSLTFTSTIGKIRRIEIISNGEIDSNFSGTEPWFVQGYTLLFHSSTPIEIVALSLQFPLYVIVNNISEVVFTIEEEAYAAGTQFTVDGLKYEVQENKLDVKLIGYDGGKPTGELAIPATAEGYNVTAIGQDAFKGCTGLTLLTIPNGVTSIGEDAFLGCSNLKAITIGSGVRDIQNDTFYNCNKVTDVYCYANPSSLNWHDATSEDPDDFKKSTQFHVASKSAWSSEFPDAHVTFVGDLNSPTLTDGTAYTRTVDQEVSTVTFVKTLGSDRIGKYQAWMVPFDYTITSDDALKFDFYRIHMIADSPAPGEISDDGNIWVYLKKMSVGDKLRGNMPYVYKPKAAVTNYEFTSTNVTLKGKTADVLLKTETTTATFSFYGTFDNTTATGSNDFFYVNINGGISFGDDVTVGPYRWILRDADKWESDIEDWPYAREMHFVDGEEDATGIQTPSDSPSMGSAWYDLQGRKLDSKPTHKGMYIVNGKKVMVK